MKQSKRLVSSFLTVWIFYVVFLLLGTVGNVIMSAEQKNALDIMIVLDNSGSMKTCDPSFRTVKIVKDFVKTVPRDSRLGIIVFDEKVHFALPLKSVQDKAFSSELQRCLKKLDYRGRLTKSPSAMERAVYELKDRGRPDAGKMIIFLTDGIVDTGDKKQDFARSQWLQNVLTADAAENNIRIFSIAFTEEADYQLIQTLAQKTKGAYFRADRVDDIRKIFSKIHSILFEKAKEKAARPGEAAAVKQPIVVPVHSPTPVPANVVQKLIQQLPFTTMELQVYIVLLLVLILGFIVFIVVRLRSRPQHHDIILPKMYQAQASGDGVAVEVEEDEIVKGKEISEKEHSSDSESRRKQVEETNRIGIKIPEKAIVESEDNEEDAVWVHDDEDVDSKEKVDEALESAIAVADAPSKSGRNSRRTISEHLIREKTREVDAIPESQSRIPQAVLQDLNKVTGQMFHSVGKPEVRIGRNRKANDIVISKPTVSKQHALIEFRDGTFFLKDLRSSNGTSVNHVRFSNTEKMCEIPLKSGDVISFDEYEFKFIVENGEGDMGRTILRRIDIPEPTSGMDRQTPVDSHEKHAEKPAEKEGDRNFLADLQSRVTRAISLDEPIKKAEAMLDEWVVPDTESEDENMKLESDECEVNEGKGTTSDSDKGLDAEDISNSAGGKSVEKQGDEKEKSSAFRFSARCYNHPDRKAPRMCSICNHNFCLECVKEVGGVILCKDCYEMYERGDISL